MGIWILMMFTLDFARFAKPEDEKYHIGVTFGWVYYLLTFLVNGLIGILLVLDVRHHASTSSPARRARCR